MGILVHLVSLLERVSRRRSPIWVTPRIHLVMLVVLVVVICGYSLLDEVNDEKNASQSSSAKKPPNKNKE